MHVRLPESSDECDASSRNVDQKLKRTPAPTLNAGKKGRNVHQLSLEFDILALLPSLRVINAFLVKSWLSHFGGSVGVNQLCHSGDGMLMGVGRN